MNLRIGNKMIFVAVVMLSGLAAAPARAQTEVYHPGETYDSLQAGRDAYLDAEAYRRAALGRQIMLEDQILAENTWADPMDKYRPISPETFGPLYLPWPRVSNDIYGAAYYGIVRQPIGHVKIWTGPQSYIYKPIYASPPNDVRRSPRPMPGPAVAKGPSAESSRPPRPHYSPGQASVPPPPRPGILPAPPQSSADPPPESTGPQEL